MSNLRLDVYRRSCPAENKAGYDGRCVDGYTSDYADRKYTCSECDGEGSILSAEISKDEIMELVREDIAKMIEDAIAKAKS